MDDIINYTMENPDNTNPNVLRGMLENYNKNSGGYTITEIVYHENKNAEFQKSLKGWSGYTFVGELPESVIVEINGIPGEDAVVINSSTIFIQCGDYFINIVDGDRVGEYRLIAEPESESVPMLTNASVKIYRKNVELTDDFILAVEEAMTIINGSDTSEHTSS